MDNFKINVIEITVVSIDYKEKQKYMKSVMRQVKYSFKEC